MVTLSPRYSLFLFCLEVHSSAVARIRIDCAQTLGELPRPWTTFGYDELNWTYTPRGKRALRAFGAFAERPYFVRAHNLLTSGRGFSWPHWGSGNVYHEDSAGNPVLRLDDGRPRLRRLPRGGLQAPGGAGLYAPRPGAPGHGAALHPQPLPLRPLRGLRVEPPPAGRPALGGADVPAGPALRRALRPGRGAAAGTGSCGTSRTSPTGGARWSSTAPSTTTPWPGSPGPWGRSRWAGPPSPGASGRRVLWTPSWPTALAKAKGPPTPSAASAGPAWTSSPSTPKAPPSAGATTPSRTTGPSSPGAATARGRGGWRCHGCHPRGRRC